jgi:hypothetical protein
MKLSWAALLCALSFSSAAPAWEAYRGADGQLRRWQPFPLALRLLPPGPNSVAPAGWERALGTSSICYRVLQPAASGPTSRPLL